MRKIAARQLLAFFLLLCVALTCTGAALATTPPVPGAPAQTFDVKAAVDTYLAKMPAVQQERSNAYFEGGYWLILWNFLYTAIILLLLLHFRWSARMREVAERITRIRLLQTAIYWIQLFVILSVLSFPLTLYQDYFRERKYGLLNQAFGAWLRDQFIMLLVGLILGAILVVPLIAIVRRLGKNWWVWGAALSVVFLAFVSLIAPVYIAPLFNQYKPLQDPRIREPILAMARANGIPASEVYEFDASRQSNRISANVSGFANTLRISLNDNHINRCTLPEIETAMGHEMGHYVLNHAYKGLVMFAVVVVLGFAFLHWGLNFSLARWGTKWEIRGITDVAMLPAAMIVLFFFFVLMTPVINTISRDMEYEADMYGLNAARQPDGAANVDLMLGEYRKMAPGPLEEFIFFDHPSGRTRITAAMRWKAEHPESANPEEMSRIVFKSQ